MRILFKVEEREFQEVECIQILEHRRNLPFGRIWAKVVVFRQSPKLLPSFLGRRFSPWQKSAKSNPQLGDVEALESLGHRLKNSQHTSNRQYL